MIAEDGTMESLGSRYLKPWVGTLLLGLLLGLSAGYFLRGAGAVARVDGSSRGDAGSLDQPIDGLFRMALSLTGTVGDPTRPGPTLGRSG